MLSRLITEESLSFEREGPPDSSLTHSSSESSVATDLILAF